MKSLLFATALLTTAAVPALAHGRPPHRPGPKAFQKFHTHSFRQEDATSPSCDVHDDLCSTCDGGNVTDTGGQQWAVSCGWSISSEDVQNVEGEIDLAICLEACDEADDCWAINIAANRTCTLVTGDPRGLTRLATSTALVRLPDSDDEPEITSTSRVQITTTIYGPGATRTSQLAVASTTHAAAAQSNSPVCNLRLNNLCPHCGGTQIDSEDGISYEILCDQDLYSNSSYSPQEWMSPAECLAECDKFDWCKGTMYYDERSCELARGDDVFPTSKADYTAFLPVPTRVAATGPQSPSAYPTVRPGNYTSPTSSAEPVFSILPIPTCDRDALTCPGCDGMPYVDKLNGTYTVMCGVEPDCVSESKFRDAAEDQEQCLQSCDQDATCLAVKWFPESNACHSCRQGMELLDRPSGSLPYVLLVADIDGDDDDDESTTTSTTTRRSTVYPTPTYTLVPPTSRSITDLPAPFSTSTSIGPVGPVIVSSMPSANPGGPIMNITTSVTGTPATGSASSAVNVPGFPPITTSVSVVSCPASNHSMYSPPDSDDLFAVICDNMFTAAHSRYTTATNFEACAASCTGQCDGIQFGYSTRCGLYTDYSIVGSATGWTIAARITDPIPVTATPTVVATSSQRRFGNSTAA